MCKSSLAPPTAESINCSSTLYSESSSSNLSKLTFGDCAFVTDLFIDPDVVEEEHLDLNDIARHYHVDVSMYSESNRNDSNRAASKIIHAILNCENSEYTVKEEYGYIFNNINADDFVQFYITPNNRVDVAIVHELNSLCIFEVHSSPFIYTIRKLVYGIVQLLRIVKAHQINTCSMVGFCFPKLSCKRSVVKVEVMYDSILQCFESSYEFILDIAKIKEKIISAVSFNKKLLERCTASEHKLDANNYNYAITCSEDELKNYEDDAVQVKCNYGVLVEATVDGELCCIKKPMYMHSVAQLIILSSMMVSGIQYKKYEKKFATLYYIKVKHDPLNNKELARCLYNYFPAVIKIVQSVHEKNIIHRDVRVPNICFNENYDPVLIDFDFSIKSTSEETKNGDFKKFTKDVIRRVCNLIDSKEKLNEDKFLKRLRKEGIFDKKLLRKSIIRKYNETLQTVIEDRHR